MGFLLKIFVTGVTSLLLFACASKETPAPPPEFVDWKEEERQRISDRAEDLETNLQVLTKNLSDVEREGFEKLKESAEAYAEAHGDGEIDSRGTSGSSFRAGARDERMREFTEIYKEIDSAKIKKFTAAEIEKMDSELNRTYQAFLKHKSLGGDIGVDKDGIKYTQRTWIKYRDSWIAFAKKKFPKVRREDLTTALSLQRIGVLKANQAELDHP